MNAPTNTLLSLEGLAVGYGRQPILQDLNLRIARGSFTGLLGPNGSGKTTLIKTLLGVLSPLTGRITFFPIDGRAPVLGYVPQHLSLDPVFPLSSLEVVLMAVGRRAESDLPTFWSRRSSEDYVQLVLRLLRFPLWGVRLAHARKARRDWALHCLEQAGAAQLGRRQFSELSGGQKQRVLIARALATKPDFLLLDEPTAGIDANAKQSILELLRQFHEEQGYTILLATHDLVVVRQYAQQAIWLRAGKAIQGPTAALLAPENLPALLQTEMHSNGYHSRSP